MRVPGPSCVQKCWTLFYAFQECLGMRPKRFLKIPLLTLAREAFLSDGARASVADVAARFGFFEPGRFAGEYRSLFGELPSDTVKRGACERAEGRTRLPAQQ